MGISHEGRPVRLWRGGVAWRLAAIAMATAGCRSGEPIDRAGVSLTPPAGWTTASLADFAVPGTPLSAWNGPRHSSLVVYETAGGPKPSAEALAEETANRLASLPGVNVVSRGVNEVGEGLQAARIVAIAPGDGRRLYAPANGPKAPSPADAIETMRVSLGIPRKSGTLWIAWHFPISAKAEISPQVDATLETLRIDPATAAPSY